MKKLSNHQKLALLIFGIWNGAGFLWGLGETWRARDPWEYTHIQPKSGCTYESILAFANPGHVLACELARKRFDIE